ncbi:MAG: ribosomal protein methyltransferase [Parcubacteria group bacterium]|nr:ribosomal protein methyltransferase [Parcubacteria group bacterium]
MVTSAEWLELFLNLIVLAFGFKLVSEIARNGKVPPFIRTRTLIAQEIADAFGTLPKGSVVYDPGCGDGRVLFAIAAKNPGVQCVGIELRLFPYFLALRRRAAFLREYPEAKVRVIRGNSFKQDLSSATHVYTYLYPEVLDRLLPKFEKELHPGTILISLDFKFLKKISERIIPLAHAEKGKLGETLYVYRF